jgi:hypothetical protein
MPALQTATNDDTDRRRHKRFNLLHSASLREGTRVVDCVIRDISLSGARVLVKRRSVTERQELVLDIEGVGLLHSRIVWQREDQAGVQFLVNPAAVQSCINAAWGRDLDIL